jgi:competence protein ComEA
MSFLFCVKTFFFIACLSVISCDGGAFVAAQPANVAASDSSININTASIDELERIPHIGEKIAARIVEHREINGPFRRVEHLMLIQGISDKRFRKIRTLVRVE